MNIYIVPLIATVLVILVLIGYTEILTMMMRKAMRVRPIIEASRRCTPVCRSCTVIDYTVEVQRQEELLEAWKEAHPLGPRSMAETAELDELFDQLAGTRMLMAMELNQPYTIKRVIDES